MRTKKQSQSKTKLLIFSIISSLIALGLVVFLAFITHPPQKTTNALATFQVSAQPASVFKGIVTSTKTDDYMLDASLGDLTDVNVKEGDSVTAGQTLLTYKAKEDTVTSLTYALKTAQLTLSNDQSNLAAAQAQATKLQNDYHEAVSGKAIATSNSQAAAGIQDPSALQSQIDTLNEQIRQQGHTVEANQLALEQAQATYDAAKQQSSSSSAPRSSTSGSDPSASGAPADLTSLEYALKQAQLTLTNSEDDLTNMQTQLKALQAQHDQAVAQKAALDSAVANQPALTDPAAVQSQIDSNNQSMKQLQQTIAADNLAVESAQASLTEAQSKGTVTVKAKSAGIAHVGDQSDTTKPVVQIVNPDTIISGQVSEFDYSKIKVGDKVTIKTLNQEQSTTGVVKTLSSTPVSPASTTASAPGSNSSSSGASYYNFTVSPDKKLQLGYNVQISVVNKDIYIPATAYNSGYVELMKKDGSFAKTKVEVESVGGGQLKVTSGLKVGDVISQDGAVQ